MTVFLILRWNGSCWRPVDEEGDRINPGPYRTEDAARLALASSQDGLDSPRLFQVWKAEDWPSAPPFDSADTIPAPEDLQESKE